MSIYDDAMEELKERDIYKYETYAPFYISSFALHNFNLMNRQRKIYYVGRMLPNNRLHLLFCAPAGYMKSYFLRQMAGDDYAIFRGSGVKIGREQEMTSPAFTGTAATANGVKTRYVGAAEEYKDGVMLIDEFKGLTDALSVQGNGQMESQLLSALDSGQIVKRLSNERIEYTSHLTLWTGIQPAVLNISSGLGRRLCYLLFIPTRKDNDVLLEVQQEQQGQKPDVVKMNKIWLRQKTFIKDLDKIERITYAPEVWTEYKRAKIYSYESTFFNNMLLGATLATQTEIEKEIYVDMKDKRVKELFNHEKEWRKKINQGVTYIQMMSIIHGLGGSADIAEVYEECTMLGLNIPQVTDLITDMVRYGMIQKRGSRVEVFKK